MDNVETSPLLGAKEYGSPSVFEAANLLREGRRQRERLDTPVPDVCLLDPDGDIVGHLRRAGRATSHPGWACYHTELFTFDLQGTTVGIVGLAVGAPFAVLVAEQLHVSGCRLLLSVSSSGLISQAEDQPEFVVIERALRDEGTSHHYLPPTTWADAPRHLLARLVDGIDSLVSVTLASTWTTDAPYRETEAAIGRAEQLGVTAVEMEAAGLYAYAQARGREVLCIAHITNAMATEGDDFEKGEHDGAAAALALVAAILDRLGGDDDSNRNDVD